MIFIGDQPINTEGYHYLAVFFSSDFYKFYFYSHNSVLLLLFDSHHLRFILFFCLSYFMWLAYDRAIEACRQLPFLQISYKIKIIFSIEADMTESRHWMRGWSWIRKDERGRKSCSLRLAMRASWLKPQAQRNWKRKMTALFQEGTQRS